MNPAPRSLTPASAEPDLRFGGDPSRTSVAGAAADHPRTDRDHAHTDLGRADTGTAVPARDVPAPAVPNGAFRQPRAVWAVAFACVISFMGIGLVDPILPAISQQLDATPSQVSLLFTSYLVVTAVMMLVVGAISSRIGAKPTMLAGLAIIVVFAGLAGSSGSVDGIVAFRAGWGLGNALFIATSLAVIVASATGGFAGAIVLYETAPSGRCSAGPSGTSRGGGRSTASRCSC